MAHPTAAQSAAAFLHLPVEDEIWGRNGGGQRSDGNCDLVPWANKFVTIASMHCKLLILGSDTASYMRSLPMQPKPTWRCCETWLLKAEAKLVMAQGIKVVQLEIVVPKIGIEKWNKKLDMSRVCNECTMAEDGPVVFICKEDGNVSISISSLTLFTFKMVWLQFYVISPLTELLVVYLMNKQTKSK
ncbi:LOW QUALITY PROTEIN: hypothetical protein HID58_043568 [Brassica napus]|uniref:Uncharacterized protein n=1 Tax=Brassica napus TaxID=3708 RepID=A0ABQ8BH01_BRANA|nr:LOW QUALITY PROTEIN: hypothetical protein HID58_043568 [Brassica napus]